MKRKDSQTGFDDYRITKVQSRSNLEIGFRLYGTIGTVGTGGISIYFENRKELSIVYFFQKSY